MRAWSLVGQRVGVVLLALPWPTAALAQPVTPAARVSMADVVRLALEHNHALRAQRLNVDISKADEITAALKPNPVFTSTNENFPFAPAPLFSFDNLVNNLNFIEALSYTFERGGKREKRTLVAQDSTSVVARTALDSERQLIFQTRQSFINVLLAKSALDLARENLKSFSSVVDLNRERMRRRRSGRIRLPEDLAAAAAIRTGRVFRRGRARAGEGRPAAERGLRGDCRRFRG